MLEVSAALLGRLGISLEAFSQDAWPSAKLERISDHDPFEIVPRALGVELIGVLLEAHG